MSKGVVPLEGEGFARASANGSAEDALDVFVTIGVSSPEVSGSDISVVCG